MLDWAVILTPVLVLGLLLLLGYVGCDFASAAVGDPPPDAHFAAPGLYIVVEVPTAFTVNESGYFFTPPTPTTEDHLVVDANPVTAFKDGPDSYYIHNCGLATVGTWIVGCTVRASENGITGSATSTSDMVNPDGGQRLRANFRTTGTPAQGFALLFKGSQGL